MKKLIIFILFSIFLASCGNGKTSEKCFEFDKSEGTITAYNNKCGGKVHIPDMIQNHYVKTIGESAFSNVEITEITFPKYLEKIGNSAFGMVKVKELIFPESMEYIGHHSFTNDEIESVKFPVRMKKIGWGAFASSKIKNIEFYDKTENGLSIRRNTLQLETSAFENNEIEKIVFLSPIDGGYTYSQFFEGNAGRSFGSNKIKHITFYEGTKKIPFSAFEKNEIESIEFPEGLTIIGVGAFSKNKLKNIKIPDSVTEIGGRAFEENEIESIEFGNSIKSIGNKAFAKNKISNIIIPASLRKIGKEAFIENNITKVDIPNTLFDFENIFDENVEINVDKIIPEITGKYSVDGMGYNVPVKIMAERRWGKDLSLPQANARCKNLELGGFKDWRIPSPMELLAIVDYKKAHIDTEFYLDGQYWNYGEKKEFFFTSNAGISAIFRAEDNGTPITYRLMYLERDNNVFVADEMYSSFHKPKDWGVKNIICVRSI